MGTRLLVTGATGQLGAYLLRELEGGPFEVTAWGNSRATLFSRRDVVQVDLTNRPSVIAAFRAARPHAVIHAAAIANSTSCVSDPGHARAVNVGGTSLLTELCNDARSRLVYVSTDLAFDGERAPYSESDPPSPTSVYGQTKVDGERVVLTSDPNAVVRVSWMFGPSLCGSKNFFDEQVAALRGGPQKSLFNDEWRTPLALHTAAQALLAIAGFSMTGVIHVGGPERMSRWEVGERLGRFLGLGTTGLRSVQRQSNPGPEPRPCDVSLNSTRWSHLFPHLPRPTFERALQEMGVG